MKAKNLKKDNLSKKQVEKDLNIFIELNSVELIESQPREEMNYSILASFPLANK